MGEPKTRNHYASPEAQLLLNDDELLPTTNNKLHKPYTRSKRVSPAALHLAASCCWLLGAVALCLVLLLRNPNVVAHCPPDDIYRKTFTAQLPPLRGPKSKLSSAQHRHNVLWTTAPGRARLILHIWASQTWPWITLGKSSMVSGLILVLLLCSGPGLRLTLVCLAPDQSLVPTSIQQITVI